MFSVWTKVTAYMEVDLKYFCSRRTSIEVYRCKFCTNSNIGTTLSLVDCYCSLPQVSSLASSPRPQARLYVDLVALLLTQWQISDCAMAVLFKVAESIPTAKSSKL